MVIIEIHGFENGLARVIERIKEAANEIGFPVQDILIEEMGSRVTRIFPEARRSSRPGYLRIRGKSFDGREAGGKFADFVTKLISSKGFSCELVPAVEIITPG